MIGSSKYTFKELFSTNDMARSLALQNVEDGAVVVAEYQTAGRGRRGASWNAAAGDSVLMTIVVHPKYDASLAWRLGWNACLSVIDTLQIFGVTAKCKWPNDVVARGQKIAGVLIETTLIKNAGYAALVGIGINVRQKEFVAADSYRLPPTSVALELGGNPPVVDDVVKQICQSMDCYYGPNAVNWDTICARYRSSLDCAQQASGVDPETGAAQSGDIVDVRETDGAALIRRNDGAFVYILPEIVPA
jgi:BirA family biotin operon repressor/biotin-[acetyl-CoA-carboxylase] ligase